MQRLLVRSLPAVMRSSSYSSHQYSYRGLVAVAGGAVLLGASAAMTSMAHADEPSAASAADSEVVPHSHVLLTSKTPDKNPLIFSGSANLQLAKEICSHLGLKLGDMTVKTFADGEIGIQVHENVRGKDVFLIQPTCPPNVNDHLMELILMVSTFRRASARRITAVIPYYGYARQDRKMASRVPISAADVAILLESMGVDRVMAVDLHCGQIQGFFGPRTPCDNLEGSVTGLEYFLTQNLKGENTVIISPDAGGVHRAKKFKDGLMQYGNIDAGLAMIIKQRSRANAIDRMDLVGNVEGMDCIIVDDMIDTAGTLCRAAAELKARGAKRIYAFATHGLFNGPAIDNIAKSAFEKVVVCNTVPLPPEKSIDKIVQLSVGHLLAEAIARIHNKQSVSELFVTKKKAE
jgi:ribose-phosphate pyrophosphokinase